MAASQIQSVQQEAKETSRPNQVQIATSTAVHRYGLTARALRYYEERGMLSPDRDQGNRRNYTAYDQQRLQWIARLRNAKLPLRDVEAVLAAEHLQGNGDVVATERLEKLRSDLIKQLTVLDSILSELKR